MVDALAFDPILLVRNPHSGFSCSKELGQGSRVSNKPAIGVSEGNVSDCKGDSVGTLGGGFGIFSNSEEIVEGNVNKVSSCRSFGVMEASCCELPVKLEKVLCNFDWDCKLWGGFGVLLLEGFQKVF